MTRKKGEMTVNEKKDMLATLKNLTSAIASRLSIASKMGMSFNNKRDLFRSCGWPENLSYNDYRNVYDRGDIGKTIITAYPDATWKVDPTVRENQKVEDESTAFEEEYKDLVSELSVYSYLKRVDRLAGIGQYGCLFLGFEGDGDFSSEVKRGSRLIYLRPLSQGSAEVAEYETNKNNERYGLPTVYKVTFNAVEKSGIKSGATSLVHWSRVIHIAEDKDESELFGIPRLKPLYNRLADCHKVLGCSAEMFWQGAFKGLAFNLDPEAENVDTDSMEEQIQKYVHSLQRYMKLQGVQVKELGGSAISPKSHIEVQLQFISATCRIPVRILVGSERGELASTQDKDNWNERVSERRYRFATEGILKPFINRLIDYDVISSPKEGKYDYTVEWPDTNAPTTKERMDINKTKTEILKIYNDAGLENIIPIEQFLEKFLEFSSDEIEEFLSSAQEAEKEMLIEEE